MLVFIHIINTGGTSIQTSLEKHLGPNSLRIFPRISLADKLARKLVSMSPLTPPFPRNGLGVLKYIYAIHGGHLQLKEYLWYAPEFSKGAVFFAVVRNPFTQVVSTYSYQQKRGAIASDLSLDEYVRQRCCEDIHCFDQTEFVTDFTGKVAVGRILRYENLEEDYDRLTMELFGTQYSLERLNPRPQYMRSLLLSDASRRLVKAKFYRDFRNFYPDEL
jgi:hypothetical protein